MQTFQDFLVLGENILRVQPDKVLLVRPAVKQIRARNQPRNVLVPETGDTCHHNIRVYYGALFSLSRLRLQR